MNASSHDMVRHPDNPPTPPARCCDAAAHMRDLSGLTSARLYSRPFTGRGGWSLARFIRLRSALRQGSPGRLRPRLRHRIRRLSPTHMHPRQHNTYPRHRVVSRGTLPDQRRPLSSFRS